MGRKGHLMAGLNVSGKPAFWDVFDMNERSFSSAEFALKKFSLFGLANVVIAKRSLLNLHARGVS